MNGNSNKHFFLGDDSDNESECENEPNQRHFSSSDSDCSDDVVGGAPTNLNFVVDDDSGLGMDGVDNDSNDSNDSSQIIPLQPVSIGKSSAPKPEQRTRRGKKYRFSDFYQMQDEHLGQGAYASVQTCVSLSTGMEYAVKLVNKHEPGHTRSRILREVEVFKMCRGQPNIVQLCEWFEDDDYFYMVFEKMQGGPLLSQIQKKICFNEQEAAQVTKDIANALKFLHSKGVAHRDLKPENVLCCSLESVSPVKLCDLDLASKPSVSGLRRTSRQLQNVQSEPDLSSPVGSAEFLAPEVVETFVGESLKYNRMCDMWSLGVITYIMISGYVPFYGECEQADSCGWNQGQMCESCQENLFEKIRQGSFDFPEEEWENISDNAKDLISHLLVKDVRKRYTANDVLKHPWISSAPETPLLHTANNLCRKNSTKDIQQINDHFNMNHFAMNRLGSRVEETIQSVGSTPEEHDSGLHDLYKNSSSYAQNVLSGASKVLEETNKEHGAMSEFYRPNNNNAVYYAPPPMLNGALPNTQVGYVPHQQVPLHYSQQPYYVTVDYPLNYGPNLNQQGGFVPAQVFDPNVIGKLETLVEEQPKCFDQAARVNSTIGPLAPAVDTEGDMLKLQQHRDSLSTAISQLGLENCQNAMIRQGSSGNEIYHQTRETQVKV